MDMNDFNEMPMSEEELADLFNEIEEEEKDEHQESETLTQEEIEQLLDAIEEITPEMQIEKISKEIADMLIKKNHDYGDDNLVKRGLLGIIIRMEDKLARLDNLYIVPKKPHVEESLEDTLKDIAGYAINAIRLLREGRIN